MIGHGLDVRRYAADLYSLLRQCDADGVQDIFAVMPSGDGLAAAIRDRLRKAAADTDRRD